MTSPLITLPVHTALVAAVRAGRTQVEASVDLGRTTSTLEVGPQAWRYGDRAFPHLERCRDRTVYFWDGTAFVPAARYAASLVKLVPTSWGAPTFEIDGIKMLPTARISPYEDARRKVLAIRPRGRRVLDTCGGLGYFAAWCVEGGAARVLSFEMNADVLWLRALNPWSPRTNPVLELVHGDVARAIAELPAGSFEAVLHDPPRFGIAGDLYSAGFYRELGRVLVRGGLLFHYTGAPNSIGRGRNLAAEVSRRLRAAGFAARELGDGVLATRT